MANDNQDEKKRRSRDIPKDTASEGESGGKSAEEPVIKWTPQGAGSISSGTEPPKTKEAVRVRVVQDNTQLIKAARQSGDNDKAVSISGSNQKVLAAMFEIAQNRAPTRQGRQKSLEVRQAKKRDKAAQKTKDRELARKLARTYFAAALRPNKPTLADAVTYIDRKSVV